MKELKCPNCGAPVDPSTRVCEYCGTHFEVQHDMTLQIVNRFEGPAKVYSRLVKIPWHISKFMSNSDKLKLKRQLAEQFVDVICENMTFVEDVEVLTGENKYLGLIRIVPPDYRFKG